MHVRSGTPKTPGLLSLTLCKAALTAPPPGCGAGCKATRQYRPVDGNDVDTGFFGICMHPRGLLVLISEYQRGNIQPPSTVLAPCANPRVYGVRSNFPEVCTSVPQEVTFTPTHSPSAESPIAVLDPAGMGRRCVSCIALGVEPRPPPPSATPPPFTSRICISAFSMRIDT
ncbi:hypothetical protein N657DRAFT_251312 [Parathielavia appendiculata]|uniref:Uncharacterized protein n=1 Tax=Parathielavia appendiculata TaxID=2587402 RepID=A0AAN6TS11_9PEZI|nr:hypothetical protein N657DRAFT_251312 [Parathielavia appendiculata]